MSQILRKSWSSRYSRLLRFLAEETRKEALIIHNQERILKAVKEKCQVAYKGEFIRITVDFSTETLKNGDVKQCILSPERKNYQLILL
jgi:hypothetical protein